MDWTLKTLIPEHFSFIDFNSLCSWINDNYNLILEPGQIYSMYIEDVVRYMSMTYSGPISYADKDGNPIDPESLKKVMKFDFEEIVF